MFEFQESGHESFDHPYDMRILKRTKVNKRPPLAPIKLQTKNTTAALTTMQRQQKQHESNTLYFPSNFHPESQKEKVEKKDSFYFKLKVISKVGKFIEKLKRGITLSNPDFKHNQMLYIENQQELKPPNFLLDSQNIFVIFFEIVVLVLSIINIWGSTLNLVYPSLQLLPRPYIIFTIAIYLLEIVANFNTEIYDNHKFEVISRKSLIAKIYMQNAFCYDLISFISLILSTIDFMNSVPVIYILRIGILTKYKSILRIKNKLQNIFSTTTQSQSLISIINLLFKVFTFIHFLSLLFNLTSSIEKQYGIQTTWIQRNNLKYDNLFELYIYGWYWGSTILTTVGFGDICPGNIYQSFLVSFVQVVCCAIFGYCINYIGSLVSVLGESKKIYEKELRMLNKYLKNLNISNKLKNKIRANCFYNHQMKELYDPDNEKIFFDSIPKRIKDQIIFKNNKSILEKTSFFKRFNEDIIKKLAMKLKRMTYPPEEFVFNKNQRNIKLWIVQKGVICDYYKNLPSNDQKKITEYDQGNNSLVGFINFVTGQPYQTYSRTKTFTFGYELLRSDFIQVIKSYKEQYIKFCEMKDLMIFKGKKYSNRCLACTNLSHNALDCPKIHYISPGIYISKIKEKRRRIKMQRRFTNRKQQKFNTRFIHCVLLDEDETENQTYQIERKSHKKLSINIPKFSFRMSNQYSMNLINQIQENLNLLKQTQITEKKTKNNSQIDEEENLEELLRLNFEKFMTSNSEDYFFHSHYKTVLAKYKKVQKYLY